MSWNPAGKVVVITGASSGIGEATAKRLAEAGMHVVAVARRVDRLEALAASHTRIVAHAADVSDTEQVDALAAFVEAEFSACHALINNAGVGGGPFDGRGDLDDAMRTIDINLLGTIRCAAAFADMLERSAPSRMINVASVAGKLGIGPAAYAASKFGMVGFSEAIGLSWAPRGISVTQLNPGFIETEGFPQRHMKGGPQERLLGTPDDVAAAILGSLASGRPERTVPRFYRGFVTLRHVAPPVYRAIAGRVGRASGTRD